MFFIFINIFLRNNNRSKETQDHVSEYKKTCLLVPKIPRNINKLVTNFKFFKQRLTFINKVVLVGNEDVDQLVEDNPELFGTELGFINENDLVDTNKVKKLMTRIDPYATRQSGLVYTAIFENAVL